MAKKLKLYKPGPIVILILTLLALGVSAYLVMNPVGSVRNSQMLNITLTNNTAVTTETVEYYENAKGFFAKPAEPGTYPGIIMIHEWWGLNSNIKDMARQLAANGYNVLAVDLYQGNVASTSGEARDLVSNLNQTISLENMRAAKQFLEDKGSPRFASLGWCFGGGQSMQLAVNEPLDATVIYYGNLEKNETKLLKIGWPVLGIFGDKDTSIPVASVNEFDAALDKLKITNEIYIYPGAGHAFANPSGMNYAPEETIDAWEKTLAFLDKNLKH